MQTALPWTQNPVARAELKHQRYVVATNRSGRVWILLAILLVVPGMVISLFYFGAALLLPFAPAIRDSFSLFDFAFGLLITVNVALYFVVTLVTLALSARSISREKEAQTWDALLLTYVEPRAIARGKWWASTRMLFGDHVMVWIARLGVNGWIVVLVSERIDLGAALLGLPAEVVLLPLLAVITVIYGALDMMFTAALGVAGALPGGYGMVGGFVLLGVRFVVMLGGLALWILTGALLVLHSSGLYLLVTLAGFAVYGLLIWGALVIAGVLVNNQARFQ